MVKKKHQGISNTLGVILVFFIMAGAAFAVYFISARIASQQPVAPTAPVSEPQASEGCLDKQKKLKCKKTEECINNVCKKIGPTPTGYGTDYTCTSTNCPSPCFSCNSTKTSCIAHPEVPYCGGVSPDGIPTPTLPGGATPTGAGPTPEPFSGVSQCDTAAEGICAADECHCLYGDVCSAYQCDSDLKTQCRQQGRSWCINQYGKAMTCCAVGYTCNPSGNGCVQTGPTGPITTPKTTTTTPTTPPTTPTSLPAACTEIRFFVATARPANACTVDNDCTIANQPEGQVCLAGVCNTWTPVSAADLSATAKVGSRIKFSFTAPNSMGLDVKVNQGVFQPATKNSATGRYDYVLNVVTSGTYNISSRYLQ